MNPQKYSLVAHDALMDLAPELIRWVEPANYVGGRGEFYISKDIEKSSVGDHYKKTMESFYTDVAELIPVIENYLEVQGLKPDDIAVEIQRFIFSFTPLGTMATHRYQEFESCREETNLLHQQAAGGDRRLYDLALHTLPEVRDITAGLQYRQDLSIDGLEYHSTQRRDLEMLAVSLCTGYGTKDVKNAQLLTNDTNQLEDNLIAAILYPWAIQPAVQLRMLVPALPEATRKRILEAYIGKRPDTFTMPGPELEFIGNSLTFDLTTDFSTYINMRRRFARIKNVRQAWTPWLGFDIPSVLGGLEAKYMERLKDLIDRSYKLFRHIQQTGLKYESQYAVLAGFRGRFMLTGSLADYALLIEYLNNSNKLSQKTAQRMYEYLSRLFDVSWLDSLIFSKENRPRWTLS